MDLIAYYHRSDGTFGEYQMHALADDEGFVVTLLLSAPNGLYVRQSSMWHPVTDPDAINGLNVHEVTADALEIFDVHEAAGRLPRASALPAP